MEKEQFNLSDCQQCQKKQQLITKYVGLIELLKKKGDRSQNNSRSFKQSIDAENSCLQLHSSPKIKLLLAMVNIQRQLKTEAMRRIEMKAVRQKCHKGFKLAQSLQRCISRRLQDSTRILWMSKTAKTGLSIARLPTQAEKSISSMHLDASYNPRNVSCFVHTGQHNNEKLSVLSRKLFLINKEVQGLRSSKKVLEEQIQENIRRQQIQSKKKKESLEMLAQEMTQKTQLIEELQTALRFYQSRQGRSKNNVLDEDGITLRREIENVEKVNEKLNIQLEKKNMQLNKLQEQLKTASERLSSLQTQNTTLKDKNFEMAGELQGLQLKKKDYYNLSSFLEKKLASLKKYQKIINKNLKLIQQHSCSQKSSFNLSSRLPNSLPTAIDEFHQNDQVQERQEIAFNHIAHFQAQYKIEKILNYVFNIQLEEIWITNEQKMFDHEQLDVLNNLKFKFIQLNEQVKRLKKQRQQKGPDSIKPKVDALRKQSNDEVYFNQQHMSGSIFDILESEKPSGKERDLDPVVVPEFQLKECPRCTGARHNGDVTTRRDNQNFTIKLLEVELEKNKQIEKISELKNKLMHIRSIVMNFMKSLQMKYLKPEARDIVEIFFELFEYSEEEKDIILHQYRKEKKFLGWF